MIKRLIGVLCLTAILLFAARRVVDRSLPTLNERSPASAAGAFHVHSEMSHDSDQKLEHIAAAARAQGMRFVVLADHNNQLAGPVTHDGITLLSFAELSTPVGHLIQMAADDVPDEAMRNNLKLPSRIAQHNGIAVVAHPSDRKRPWQGTMVDVGGIEIANLASSARMRAGPAFVGLLPALFAWRLNPRLALAQVYARDDRSLARWDEESNPRVVGLCGSDAHGRIDLGLNLEAWRVILHHPLPVAPSERASFILDQLEHGRFHCVAGLFGKDPDIRFGGQRDGRWIAEPGDTVPASSVDALVVRSPTPARAEDLVQTILLRNGAQVARTVLRSLTYDDPAPGTYRVEVLVSAPGLLWGKRTLPAVYTNRIRLQAEPNETPPAAP